MTAGPAGNAEDTGPGFIELLARIECYYDAAPRVSARVEEIGPFVLFVQSRDGWPYYARPRLGSAGPFTAEVIMRLRERQRALGVPEAFEWVHQVTPGLLAAARAAGLSVHAHPLMALMAALPAPAPPPGVRLRLVTEEDDLTAVSAVADVGFGVPGTAAGPAGVAERDRAAAERAPDETAHQRERLRAGLTVTAAAFTADGPVAVGSHQPVDGVSEVVGVATLPAFRRRGIAAALTALLAGDARARGADTVFLSAGDAAVARIYARLGFRMIGAACIAEPAA